MIISHKYKFIFVKTAKTAGTSIEVFLSNFCGPLDVVTPIIPPIAYHAPKNHHGFHNHMPAHAIRRQGGTETWNSYFKFCVERNPWDKAISHFHAMKSRQNNNLTFADYLSNGIFPINFKKYTEPNNPQQIIVDTVIHYEKLMDELNQVFKRLGIPFDGSLGVNAKAEYRTDRRHYREAYTAEQATVIANAFKHELFLHEYSF
jgi:Sulfotransferase family